MQEVSFARLCTDAPLRQTLQHWIDGCAIRGQGYELPQCQMPEGCSPARAVLGFFRRTSGEYVMYWRPAIRYQGASRPLWQLFERRLWSFPSYPVLCERLCALCTEVPASATQPVQAASSVSTLPFPVLRRELGERIFGQTEAVDAVAYYLSGHMGKCAPSRPLSLVLHGPTGVGKSELAKAVVPALKRVDGRSRPLVWTELNTFTQAHSVHRLIGAPPGYVGYEDEPVFAAVKRDPHTVFLFDELDKAHPDVLKVFMSLLDEGRCSLNRVPPDGQRELDFRRCIFLFTTNADLSSSPPRRAGFCLAPTEEAVFAPDETNAAAPEALARRLFQQNERGRKALIRQGVLQEIAGRFTGFVGFQPLSAEAQRQILAQKAVSLGTEYGLSITSVLPEAEALLLPSEPATSLRSLLCLLEARLSPLYQRAAGTGQTAYQLTASSGSLALSSVDGTVRVG